MCVLFCDGFLMSALDYHSLQNVTGKKRKMKMMIIRRKTNPVKVKQRKKFQTRKLIKDESRGKEELM